MRLGLSLGPVDDFRAAAVDFVAAFRTYRFTVVKAAQDVPSLVLGRDFVLEDEHGAVHDGHPCFVPVLELQSCVQLIAVPESSLTFLTCTSTELCTTIFDDDASVLPGRMRRVVGCLQFGLCSLLGLYCLV